MSSPLASRARHIEAAFRYEQSGELDLAEVEWRSADAMDEQVLAMQTDEARANERVAEVEALLRHPEGLALFRRCIAQANALSDNGDSAGSLAAMERSDEVAARVLAADRAARAAQ